MPKPITLKGFEATFRGNPDPWRTFAAPDERRKRQAIVHAVGGQRVGRMLELAAGNGSNSAALSRRALRLDATDGAPTAVELIARAVAGQRRVAVSRLALPGRFPADRYDAIVAAEILYYLSPRDLAATAREVRRTLRSGGMLVLAHHHVRFADAALDPATVHARFLRMTSRRSVRRWHLRTARWRVSGYRLA